MVMYVLAAGCAVVGLFTILLGIVRADAEMWHFIAYGSVFLLAAIHYLGAGRSALLLSEQRRERADQPE